jgi:cell division protein FtsN
MTMRHTLPYLLALLLGVGAALLAACGQGTRGGIPAADASSLNRELEGVRSRVADGQCGQLASQLRAINTRIDGLPRSVDPQLVQALRNGADRLQRRAVAECNAKSLPTDTATQTTPTVTETTTTPDTTTQPDTTTTPTPTDTTPTPTDTTPTPTDTLPPVPTEPPPPVTPGGGVSPEIP